MSVQNTLDKISGQVQDLTDAAAAEREQVSTALGKLDEVIALQNTTITELKENQVDVNQLEKVSENLSAVRDEIGGIFTPETE